MHKDLEKYAGMALQGIMSNSAHFYSPNEIMVENAIQVAEFMCARLDHLREEHLADIKSRIDELPKTKIGIPIFNDLALFRDAEETKIKECVISGFLREVSFGYATIVFENGDVILIYQLTGMDLTKFKCVPDKHIWFHLKSEFCGWVIIAVEEAQTDNE